MISEKIKILANEMMEAFQQQWLTYDDVDKLVICLQTRTKCAEQRAIDGIKKERFTALPF